MDPSHDSRSAADATARPDDIDPWSEFLSESSDELQQLQTTRSTTSDPSAHAGESRPGVSIVPLPGDGESSFADELPPTAVATTSSPEDEPPSTSAVSTGSKSTSRVSAGQLPGHSERTRARRSAASGRRATIHQTLYGRPFVPVTRSGRASNTGSGYRVTDDLQDCQRRCGVADASAHAERRRKIAAHSPGGALCPDGVDLEAAADVDEHALRRSDTVDEAAVPTVAARETTRETIPSLPTAPTRRPVKHASDSLPLSDVLSRQTPVHWPEAVATVQELCVTLDAGNADEVLVPDLADIFITSAGAVGVKQGAAGETDVAALGRTLQSLLTTSSPPLPLRLFVTSAVSSERYASVGLFADALSYYATTSGRTQLIQALYKRAMERTPVLPVVAPRQQLARPERAAPCCGESRPAEDLDDRGCGRPRSECAGGCVALDCRTVVGRRQQGGERRRSALHPETDRRLDAGAHSRRRCAARHVGDTGAASGKPPCAASVA